MLKTIEEQENKLDDKIINCHNRSTIFDTLNYVELSKAKLHISQTITAILEKQNEVLRGGMYLGKDREEEGYNQALIYQINRNLEVIKNLKTAPSKA